MGIVAINDGTILAPGLRFEEDLNTGFIRTAADTLGYVAGGVLLLKHSTGAFAFQESTTISAATGTLTLGAVTLGGAVAGGDYAFTNVGDMTFATGSILASGSTNGNTLLVRANDTTFITLTTGVTDVCTLDAITMSGTWLASGTVTLPAFTLGGTLNANGQVISGVHQLQSTDSTYTVIRRDAAKGWIFDVKGAGAASKQVVAFSGETDTPVVTWLAAATHTNLTITSAGTVAGAGTGANGFKLKNLKNAAATALSGTQLDVEIDIGGTPYYFTVFPTKA